MGSTKRIRAALMILFHYLGDEWCKKHLFRSDGSPSFMRPQNDPRPRFRQQDLDQFRYMDRMLRLAECLLNFPSIEGFCRRLMKLQTEDLETCLAELKAAKLILSSGIPFRFVDEIGVTGSDYDIEMHLNETVVACESKCKIEDTEMSSNSVENTLGQARKQLPADKAGVVFLTIPELWARHPESNDKVIGGINAVFGNTRRISAVIIQYEMWDRDENGGPAASAQFFSTIHNERARIRLDEFGEILRTRSDLFWRRVDEILENGVNQYQIIEWPNYPMHSTFTIDSAANQV
jgi:hypothetical protein